MNWKKLLTKLLTGWKTYVGAAIILSTLILEVCGHGEAAKRVLAIGGALGLIGLRHAAGRIILTLKMNGFMKDLESGTVKVS